MYHKSLSLLLVTSLIVSSTINAEETSSTVPTQLEASPPAQSNAYSKALESNLTRQILKKLGEPGFYVSKFLNYRKQINQPTCTLSEQINKASILTALTGEITTHAFDYFETRKLKKKFAAKIEQINKYTQDLVTQEKKMLEYDNKSPDIQLDSLQHLRDMAEIELKRAEMVRVFAYTTLGLQITSKILASMEGTAEIASFGSTTASIEACKAAKQAQQLAAEARVEAILAGHPLIPLKNGLQQFATDDSIPWYLIPFQYLAKGIDFIETSKSYQAINTYKRGVNKDALIKNEKEAQPNLAASDTLQYMQIADSAAYAEEMMVGVVYDVIEQWKKGKNPRDITNEINGLNQKEESGIMKFFRQVGAGELAIRFAVRSLIKANLIQVNTFMRSGFGRFVSFSFNVYVTYRTIAENEAQVDYAKRKIALLDKTIKDFSLRTTWLPTFQRLMDALLPSSAFASTTANYIFPRPPCIKTILPDCSTKNLNIISNDAQSYFRSLPKEVQEAQKNILSQNYALKSALKLATGKTNYDEIDLDKTKNEIKWLERYSDQLEKNHPKKNNFIANQERIIKKLKNEVIFPKVLLASFGNIPVTDALDTIKTQLAPPVSLAQEGKSLVGIQKEDLKEAKTETSQFDVYDYDFQMLYTKEADLFQVITNRYFQIYSRKGL